MHFGFGMKLFGNKECDKLASIGENVHIHDSMSISMSSAVNGW